MRRVARELVGANDRRPLFPGLPRAGKDINFFKRGNGLTDPRLIASSIVRIPGWSASWAAAVNAANVIMSWVQGMKSKSVKLRTTTDTDALTYIVWEKTR